MKTFFLRGLVNWGLLFLPILVSANVNSESKYNFTSDWFSINIPTWEKVLNEYKGKENVRYLEVGVYEGRSFFWVLDNILTNKTSSAVAIDFFKGSYERRFLENLKISKQKKRVTIKKGFSKTVLRTMGPSVLYDIIYIDASHLSRDVLTDAILAWDLLKEDGVLIFDDYENRPELPRSATPKMALNAFVEAFEYDLSVIHKGYQLIVKKIKNPCGSKPCIPIGNVVYDYINSSLYQLPNKNKIALDKPDEELILKYLKLRDENKINPNGQLESFIITPDFKALQKKLNIVLDPPQKTE